MRPFHSIAVAGVLAFSGLAAGLADAAVLQSETHTFKITKEHRVHVNFPVGELRVIPTDDTHVEFDIRVRCRGRAERDCEELANQLVLDSHDSGQTLSLKLENYPKWHHSGFTVIGELHVPRAQALRIEMGVGQLDISGLEGDLDVDLGVGEADIRTTRASAANVSVETGIGDATIRGAGADLESSRFLGARASWSGGGGKADVRLHVGVGDATVRLE
jgi:hypothetical protein